MPPPDLDWRWFAALFIGGWLAISWLLSRIGGWHQLAKQYPGTSTTTGKLFRFESMDLGPGAFPVNYRRILFVRLNSHGIAISNIPLFRIFHPRLFIPWNAVSEVRRERFWFQNRTAVYVAEPPTRMLFRGRLGQEIFEARCEKSHSAGAE